MSSYDVELIPLPPLAVLEAQWLDLQARARPSFYTTWSWIGTWLESLPPGLHLYLWRASLEGQVMGLGVLTRRWRKRGGVPVCEAWYLHATGGFAQDVVWVEHNDLLVDERWGVEIRAAMLVHWQSVAGPGAVELRLPGLADAGWCDAGSLALERVDDLQSCCSVGLDEVRAHQLDFIPLLSSNTRRFIRRSLKEYQTLGPVALHQAVSADQAWAWFQLMGELSRARWSGREVACVFLDPFFNAFHERLIVRCFDQGQIQMLRIQAGEHDIAFLYSFVHGGRVYVYQSGCDYNLLEKHNRPGLVAHTLAIEHNAALGHDCYDLMAGGESQYKSTLSTRDETLTWVVLRRPALRFQIEDKLRQVARDRRAARQAAQKKAIPPVEAAPADTSA